MRNFFILIIISMSLFSCANIYKHGYMFEYSGHDLVEIGNDKISVFKLMGSPTIISDIEDETWIYFYEKTKSFLFFKPKVIDRNILVIEFNHDRVVDIRTINLSNQLTNFNFSQKKTPVLDHKTGIFADFFANIGSVKPQ